MGFRFPDYGRARQRLLKDEFGARFVRVRGPIKVKCPLMFGVVAFAVDQILRLTVFRPAPS
jgi:hypothetical protein